MMMQMMILLLREVSQYLLSLPAVIIHSNTDSSVFYFFSVRDTRQTRQEPGTRQVERQSHGGSISHGRQ